MVGQVDFPSLILNFAHECGKDKKQLDSLKSQGELFLDLYASGKFSSKHSTIVDIVQPAWNRQYESPAAPPRHSAAKQ